LTTGNVSWHGAAPFVFSLLAMVGFTAVSEGADVAPPPAPTAQPETADLSALWSDTAHLLGKVAEGSRILLLGTRDPNGPSCVQVGAGVPLTSRRNGGVGTRTCYFMAAASSHRTTAPDEYRWQQTALTAYLQNLRVSNREAHARALRLADQTQRLAAALDVHDALPANLAALGFPEARTRLAYPAYGLDRALAARTLREARVWAREFHAAAFALADLHRWTDFIMQNQFTALAFQARCADVYRVSDRRFDIADKVGALGQDDFPAGQAMVCNLYNLMEIERQAEGLFAQPPESWQRELAGASAGTGHVLPAVPAAVWMPLDARQAFTDLRGYLSPPNQALWDEAASAPYDRTYLANMLYRYQAAGVPKEVGVVLERFDRVHANPARHDLMDVLFYRAGSPGSNPGAAERFDSRLMQAAATLGGTDEQVLLGAQFFARALFGSWKNYCFTPTLLQALDLQKFDCISATDVIASLYRNAGRGGFYTVRWCAGSAGGHTVAGARLTRNGKPAIGIVDGLDIPQTRVTLWPQDYADGPRWPTGYVGRTAPIVAIEILSRGLDAYTWAEGLIVRGQYAGTLVGAPIPYLPALPGQTASLPMPVPAEAASPAPPPNARPDGGPSKRE